MSVVLIQAIQRCICSLLMMESNSDAKKSKNKSNDEVLDLVSRTTQNASTLAAFAVAALLRAINPYVSSVPILLSPLWKALGDMLSKMPSPPPDLTRAALTALMVYVKEGERPCLRSAATLLKDQSSPTHPTEVQQYLFHVKVLGFLLARFTTLLPMYINNSSEEQQDDDSFKLVAELFVLLVRVRGIPIAIDQYCSVGPNRQAAALLLPGYKSLSKKVDQCILKSVLNSQALLNHAPVTHLLSIKTTSQPTPAFEARCLRLGKLNVLQTILQQANPLLRATAPDTSSNSEKDSKSNAELIVLIAEQAIFSTLPQQEQIKQDQTTVRCESIVNSCVRATIVLETTGKGNSVRQMLLKWLSRRLHPTSREAVVTLVYNHVIGIGKASHGSSPRSSVYSIDPSPLACTRPTPMLDLLAQVFFDFRTSACHRENIASVWHRLLAASSDTSIKALSRRVMMNELTLFLKKLRTDFSKKRKRMTPSLQHNVSTLALDDWTTILNLIPFLEPSSAKSNSTEALSREVTALMNDLGNRDDSLVNKKKGNGIFHLAQRTPLELAVILSGAGSKHVEQKARALQLTGWFLTQAQRRRKDVPLTRNGTILTAAVLQFLSRTFHESGTAVTSVIGPVVRVLTWAVEQTKLLLSYGHTEDCGIMLALAAGSVLRTISRGISPSTPPVVMQQLASSFRDLFKLGVWTLTANTMSCLIEFASTLAKAHQGILMKCLPVEMQALFTCRLQGLVHRPNEAHTEAESGQAQDACAHRLSRLIMSVPVKNSPLATSTTNTLAIGSFLLNMPTMEDSGRSALVIFPPGEQSLEDIKHMLQKDSIDGEDVRVLQQVRAAEGNVQSGAESGYRLYSIKYGRK
jgi:hypothetical protein